MDFRIEVMKRFIINDNHVYSEEILNLFISIITVLGIDRWFSDQIRKIFINYNRIEYLVRTKFIGKIPPQMIDRLRDSIDEKSYVFLSQK